MIDFHAHIDLYPRPDQVAKKCIAREMDVLSVTTTPSAWKGTSELVAPGSRIHSALGLHPQIAHVRKSELELFDSFLPATIFVGEIGLDGAPEFKSHWADQLKVFRHILKSCSNVGGRIMSIHSRRAAGMVLDELSSFPLSGIPILHWFSGEKRDLDRAITQCYWFSVGPAMLTSAKSREMIINIPRERILTETDGPFAKIAGTSMMPWDVSVVVPQLAAIWKITDREVEMQLNNNLCSLLKQHRQS